MEVRKLGASFGFQVPGAQCVGWWGDKGRQGSCLGLRSQVAGQCGAWWEDGALCWGLAPLRCQRTPAQEHLVVQHASGSRGGLPGTEGDGGTMPEGVTRKSGRGDLPVH